MVVQYKAEKMKLDMKNALFVKFGLTQKKVSAVFESPAKAPKVNTTSMLGALNVSPAAKVGSPLSGLLTKLSVSPE